MEPETLQEARVRGMVFTEFMAMVDERFGPETTERLIDAAALADRGAYTNVGSCDHEGLLRLVGALSQATGIPAPDLVRAFGEHLFGRFVRLYPRFFERVHSCFEFLSTIENHIHVEVRKLYPDSERPTFACSDLGSGRMEMVYRSSRPFGDLAEGLIRGCAAHFGDRMEVRREDLPSESGTAVRGRTSDL